MSNTETKQVELVSCGLVIASKGRKGHCFYRLDDPDKKSMVYLAKGKGWSQPFTPGGVYIVTMEGDDTIKGRPSWTRQHDDPDEVLRLQIEHKANVGHFEREALRKRLGDDDVIAKALEPIREAMRATNPAGRSAIKCYVLSQLERW